MKLFFSTIFLISVMASAAHSEPASAPDVLKACKNECPNAKTDMEAFGCGEALEHKKDNAKFKESACFKAHHEFEAYLTANATLD